MNLKAKQWGWLLYLLSIFILGHTAISLYSTFMPASHWITYYEVKPAKDEFEVNEKLRFISLIEAHRKCRLDFNDILYCRNIVNGKFERESEQPSQSLDSGPYLKQYRPWPYLPGVPYATTCYLVSNIVVNNNKSIKIVGPEFQIVGEEINDN